MNFAEDIKRAVTMRQVVEYYGLTINRAGFVNCPFHRERTASMRIYDDNYHCYGCEASGDVITFVRNMDGLGFIEACEKLNTAFSLGLPIGEKISPRAEREAGRRAWQRRKEIQARKEAAGAAEQAFWDAYDEWLTNLSAAEKLAPKSKLEALTDEYIDAVMATDQAEDRLEQAGINLYEFEKNY